MQTHLLCQKSGQWLPGVGEIIKEQEEIWGVMDIDCSNSFIIYTYNRIN